MSGETSTGESNPGENISKPNRFAWFGEFTKGLIAQNPVLALLLGLCPSLAVTTSLKNAIGMGLAATAVLVMSNIVISLIRTFIPSKVRIPCFIVVIATFVSLVQLLMKAYLPRLNEALGIFLPLIVVNCIILGRAEAFASKNTTFASILDGLGMGLGFSLALMVIGSIREILGTGKLLDIPITNYFSPNASTFKSAAFFIMAPGAFLVFSVVLAVMAGIKGRTTEEEFRTGYMRGLRLPEEVRKIMAAKQAADQEERDEANPFIESSGTA